MKYLTLLVALAFCILVGCSRETSVETPKAEVPVKTADLGVIEVADRLDTLIQLAGGKTCRITPTFKEGGIVLLEMRIEENGKLLSAPRVQTAFDMPVTIAVGDTAVSFTPRKKP